MWEVIYNLQCHWVAVWLAQWLTGSAPRLCVLGDSAVWPPAQRAAETVSAALPVLQPPTPHQSAVPLPHLGVLQQLPKQGDPAAGDELCAAGYVHSGKTARGGGRHTCSLRIYRNQNSQTSLPLRNVWVTHQTEGDGQKEACGKWIQQHTNNCAHFVRISDFENKFPSR